MSTGIARRVAAAALPLLAAAAGWAQPANDSCDNAPVLTEGVAVNGTTVGASADVQVTCQQDTADVYYAFTTSVFSSYTFTLTGASPENLSLSIVSGCRIPYGEYACASGNPAGVTLEQLFVAGDSFYVRVGSTVAQSFTLTVNVSPPPVNDECAAATPLFLNTPISTNNFTATTTLEFADGALCSSVDPGLGGGADVFFAFTAPSEGYYDFSTCGAQLNTVITVHSACPATAANVIACNDNAALSRCNIPFDSVSSYAAGVEMVGGQTYYVRVAGVRFLDPEGNLGEPGRGSFDLLAQVGSAPVVPANDDCANAELLFAESATLGTTVNATNSVTGTCGFDDVWDVWYSFTSEATERRAFIFELLPGAFNASATMSVYDECGGAPFICYESNPFVSPEILVWVVLDPGQTVKLRVAGQGASQDEFTLFTSMGNPGAINVTCAAAEPLAAGETVVADTTGTNTGAPTECGYNDISPLWYSFTATTPGYYRFATDFPFDPESFDSTVLVVYDQCGGNPVACSTHGEESAPNPNAAALALRLEAGETRYFRVSYRSPRRAAMNVSVTGPLPAPPPVTNDTCGAARVITMPHSESVDVTVATPDLAVCAFEGEPLSATPGGVWYEYTPDVDRVFSARVTVPQEYAPLVSVFTGSCGSLTQIGCGTSFIGGQGIPLTAGTTYRILVSLVLPTGGEIDEIPYGTTYEVEFIAPPHPANDHCATAARISADAEITINTLSADPDAPEPSCVGMNGVLNNAVWYTLTPSTPGTLTVNGRAADLGSYSPGGVLYRGSCSDLTEVACDTPLNGWLIGFEFEFTVELQAGQTYFLAVGSWANPAGGETVITVDYTGELGCRADFNADGQVSSQDFFDFLTAFFTETPNADFNSDGQVNSQDFFDFLAEFFTGCE